MHQRSITVSLALVASLFAFNTFAQQKSILFETKHAQTAGNADWTLDEDTCGTAQRYPTPDQAGITSSTPETYWSGGMSAFGVDMVKKGFHVESLPTSGKITYGDSTNAQDLSHYNVLVSPEPNTAFTAAEVTAIKAFVNAGGGFFMIADHAGADRDNNGIDAAGVFNQLMGSPSVFGITFDDNSSDSTGGWFDDDPDDNFTTDTSSPIIFTGPYGSPHAGKGLGLFGASTMAITGNAKAHIWKSGASHGTTLVTFATSTYGSGRVASIGDTSTAEDATNGCGHTTYLGYNDPSWDNGLILANAVAWLANGSTGGSDTQAPTVSISAPTAGSTVSNTTAVNATASDNVGVTKVEFYLDGALKSTDTTSPFSWSWDTTTATNASHSLQTKAYDAANNVGTSTSVSVTVSNVSGAPTVSITAPTNGATVSGTTSVTATATDNVSVTKVEFYLDGTLKSTDTTSPYAWSWDTTTATNASHTLTAKAYDGSSNVTTSSAVGVTVNNAVTGSSVDVSGWTVIQANASITYTIPSGTVIPANGYLIIARDATKAAFQSFWGVTLASNVIYLTTGSAFPQINGGETYTVKHGSTTVDGATIAMSSSASQDLRRKDPCQAANLTASWNVGATTTATPGSGAGAGCAHGVVINEFSDADGSGNFGYEFIELHNDQ